MIHKSCGLAAQTFMLSIVAAGYDCCPMEGFDARYVKKALNLLEDTSSPLENNFEKKFEI
jgi:nitroreductase